MRSLGSLALCAALLAGCGGTTDRGPGDGATPAGTPTSGAGSPTPGASTSEQVAAPQVHESLQRTMTQGVAPVPTAAAEAAAMLLAAESAIADPATSGPVLAAAGKVQQRAYRELGQHPEWDAAVRAALPHQLHRVVDLNVSSRRALRSMHPPSSLSSTLPPWRIVAPPPVEQLRQHYLEAERTFGVGWEYLAAVNLIETTLGRIRGTSVAGAQGPMQFMPGTWAQYGRGDVNDPRDAILAAGRYLSAMGFARDKARALYRYNNSDAYVRAVTAVAQVIELQPRALLGYHQWEVFYLTTAGEVLLPVGYAETTRVPVEEYLNRRPAA